MDTKKLLVTSAIAAAFAVGAPTVAKAEDMGKCFGVAEAAKNDCGANDHSCAGQAKTNYDVNEWKKMSKKACDDKHKALKDTDGYNAEHFKNNKMWEKK